MMAASSIRETLDEASLPSNLDVTIYESTDQVLRTIRSHYKDGILYDTSKKPRDVLNAGYPRGRKEITSLLTKYFPPIQQQKWFEDRGIEFTTRQDGIMISIDDDVSSILSALMHHELCGTVETKAKVTAISKDKETGCFHLSVNGRIDTFDCVVLATGNSHLGHQLAKSVGHTITKSVRSCFELVLKDASILSHLEEGSTYDLPYVRLSYKVSIKGQKRPRIMKSEGSVQLKVCNNQFILTGMASLSLSSLAAYELKEAGYLGTLLVHFCPDNLDGKVENVEEFIWQYRQDNPNEVIGDKCPLLHTYVDYDDYDWETDSFKTVTNECIPADLWQGLVQECGMPYGSSWSKISPKKCRKLAELMVGCSLEFSGRYTSDSYPFINAGGISLREIDMNSMQSKVVDGMFCCGQVLDGDASHNCFSLMKGFATGKLAGERAVFYAKDVLSRKIISMAES